MEYLFFAIIIVSLVTMALSYRLKGQLFDQVIRYFLACIAFHASYTLCYFKFFFGVKYLDAAVPFGLLYGPFFYFAYSSLLFGHLGVKRVLVHLLPFLTFLMLCTVVFVSQPFRENFLKLYYMVLYSLIPLSMLSYTVWAIFQRPRVDQNLRHMVKLIVFFSVVLMTIALFFLRASFKIKYGIKTNQSFSWLIIYGTMLSVVLTLAYYYIQQGLHRLRSNRQKAAAVVEEDIKAVPKYEKSAVSPALLVAYEQKLEDAMLRNQHYLEPELSLEELAKYIKAPKHHVTQVFNVQIRKNFYQYVNGYRIKHACTLLQEADNRLTLEEIAYRSGFNAKTSFNRQFKNLKGCTPSQYRGAKLKQVRPQG